MASPLRTYAFINAKLRTRLSLVLPVSFQDQLIRTPDLPAALALLRETSFSSVAAVYERTGDLRMAELELFGREVALHLELERYLRGRELVFARAMAARYEIETLKSALRVWFDRAIRGHDTTAAGGTLYRGRIHHDIPIDRLLAAPGVGDVVGALADTHYGAAVAAHARSITEGSLFETEIELDRGFFARLLAAAAALAPVDRDIAERMIAVEIDLLNAAWMVRFRVAYNLDLDKVWSYLLPSRSGPGREEVAAAYQSGRVTELVSGLVSRRYPSLQVMLTAPAADELARLVLIERILQQIMLHEVGRLLAGYPFTIGTVLAYVVLKRNEIRSLMTILNAKLYGLSAERTRSAL
jgi:V/A-type H+/Na+-transporting ATPase subunit C